MILETDFLDHWKTKLFVQMIGYPHATHHVLRLWFHCQNRKTWEFPEMTNDVLKVICGYDGDGETLRSALVTVGFALGFQDGIACPNWAEMNSKLIANWENGVKGGRPKKTTKNKPKIKDNNPAITQTEPSHNPDVTDRLIDRVDREIEEPVLFQSDNVFQDLPKQLDSPEFRKGWLAWECYWKQLKDRAFQPYQRLPAWQLIITEFEGHKLPETACQAITSAIAGGWVKVYPPKKREAVAELKSGDDRYEESFRQYEDDMVRLHGREEAAKLIYLEHKRHLREDA